MNLLAHDIQETVEQLNQQGNACWQKGEKEQGEKYFTQALDMAPFNPMTLNAMGVVKTDQKDYKEAEQLLLKALTFAPQYAPVYDNLGRALYFMKRFDEAAARFETAIELDPEQPEYYFNLGTVKYDLRDFQAAADQYDHCIKIAPRHTGGLIGKGQSLSHLGLIDQAGECYKEALKHDPRHELAYHNLYIYYDLTHNEEKLKATLDLAREHMKGTTRLAYMEARYALKKKDYETGIKMLETIEITPDPFGVDVLFEAGWLYDKNNEPDKAFNCFVQANKVQSQGNDAITINVEAYPGLLKSEKAVITKENLKNWTATPENINHPDPVFLVGFPRSGTTLTGQILHSHPDIYVGEENGAIEETRHFIAKKMPGYPGSLAWLDEETIEEARNTYFAVHKQQADWENTKIFVDKSPVNSAQVGFIHRLFPKARFIFVRRHPCDCVLSCLMQKFRPSLSLVQFMELERAASFYKLVIDCWEHYNEVLSPDRHILRYEDLVDNFEEEVRKLLDYTGVPWNASVLEYNKKAKANPRTITPSYDQVTQEIYTSARYRWERYRDQMEPVLDTLAPYVTQAGYDAVK